MYRAAAAFGAVARGVANARGGVVQVAVAVPLRRVFDYRCDQPKPPPGARVQVPFGRRRVVGVVVSHLPPRHPGALKSIGAVLDRENLFGGGVFALLGWGARYYHHPLGEVLHTALPTALRHGKPLADPWRRRMLRAVAGVAVSAVAVAETLRRAPLQAKVYARLVAAGGWLEAAQLTREFAGGADAVRRLCDKRLVEMAWRNPADTSPSGDGGAAIATDTNATDATTVADSDTTTVQLNPAQRRAVDAIAAGHGRFGSFALHGITGSGKTEVYLEAAAQHIARGEQVLLLVPEIALTPQLVARVRARLGAGVCVLHSALSAGERYRAWWQARTGQAAAVLGTRSAVFTPMKTPGLIVVDEEHDISYKQQDGWRYHARDLAIKRASLERVPVVLGSATPSMETHHNSRRGRHHPLTLTARSGGAKLPRIDFIDLNHHRPTNGLSAPLITAIGARLSAGEQSIIFLNRRGFAPLAKCPACGWHAACQHCDSRLTYHRDRERLRCHHCGAGARAVLQCADCARPLFLAGAGTQRLEAALRKRFPGANIARLDRDQITDQHALEREFAAIRSRHTDIIIGTQLIVKGHDFEGVTLVGVVNSDQGLYSADFRAPEYLFQQLTQVSGRAGRAAAAGEVLIQTAHPDHPTLQHMRRHQFTAFAQQCLAERRAARQPPFAHLALWRAESPRRQAALQFLRQAAALGTRLQRNGEYARVEIMDAVISPMEKLAGRYRAQLLIRSPHRGQLHSLLEAWLTALESTRQPAHTRWSVDVDPMEMG